MRGGFGNLLFWAALGYLALRITPTCGRPLLLLLVMPMTLFQAASLSADATTNCLAVLFTVMVLRYANVGDADGNPSELRSSEKAWRIWESACYRLCGGDDASRTDQICIRPTARPVVSASARPFRRSEEIFRRRRNPRASECRGAAGLDIANAGPEYHRPREGGVSPAGQAQYLRDHPSMVWTITRSTIANKGSAIVRSFVGRLGWLDIPMSFWFTDAYLLAMAAACWLQKNAGAFVGT